MFRKHVHITQHNITMDDLFLPTIFLVFISGLSSVFAAHYYLKPSETNTKWSTVTRGLLYLLSAVSFLLQLKATWMRDFLHQFELVTEPVLWQRQLDDFILVRCSLYILAIKIAKAQRTQ